MKKLILVLLLICSVHVLEASSSQQIAIGYNPADFTIAGKSMPGAALTDVVITGLHNAHCSNDNGISYIVVASEDSRMMEILDKEIKFSSSSYADPATRLRPNTMVATYLVKGNATFEQGSVSINLRIEDRQGCLRSQAKVSGAENNFYKLIDEATRSLGDQMCMPESNVQNCPKNYYTVTVNTKTTSKVKPLEQYRGISKTLKSFEEDKDVYYIYVDVDKAKIEQYHIDKLSIRKIHKEVYELNMKSCKYEVKSKDKVVKNLGGRNIFKSEDAGWGFEDSSKIYVELPSSDKQLSFTWGSLQENGTYHASKAYKKKIPKIVKELMGKVNGMATLFRNETKNSKEIEYFKNLYDYPGTPHDIQCGGKVSMESMLIPPLDGLQYPDVEFSIDIQPSTKSEIKVMKAFLNNEVGNLGDFILKALQQAGGDDGK